MFGLSLRLFIQFLPCSLSRKSMEYHRPHRGDEPCIVPLDGLLIEEFHLRMTRPPPWSSFILHVPVARYAERPLKSNKAQVDELREKTSACPLRFLKRHLCYVKYLYIILYHLAKKQLSSLRKRSTRTSYYEGSVCTTPNTGFVNPTTNILCTVSSSRYERRYRLSATTFLEHKQRRKSNSFNPPWLLQD